MSTILKDLEMNVSAIQRLENENSFYEKLSYIFQATSFSAKMSYDRKSWKKKEYMKLTYFEFFIQDL